VQPTGASHAPQERPSAAQLGGTAGETAWQLGIEKGGALTQKLSDLYEYMTRCLVHANLHSDSAAVGEVPGLLGEIRAHRAAIGSQVWPGWR
jgi:flagellar biosynthetic protein FliS